MLISLSRLICQLFLLTLLFVQLSVPIANATEENPAPSTPQIELKRTENTPAKSEQNPVQKAIDRLKQQPQNLPTDRKKIAYPTPPNPYDNEMIEKFNEELYGD
jgi:hypothetical protein